MCLFFMFREEECRCLFMTFPLLGKGAGEHSATNESIKLKVRQTGDMFVACRNFKVVSMPCNLA